MRIAVGPQGATTERDENTRRFVRGGPEKLRRLRDEGIDPAHSAEALAKQLESRSRTFEADWAWNVANLRRERLDPDVFRREILPRIQGIPLKKLAETTGLSLAQCGRIRSGQRVPHARHWEGLAMLPGKDSAR